jgi:hypothetical protein
VRTQHLSSPSSNIPNPLCFDHGTLAGPALRPQSFFQAGNAKLGDIAAGIEAHQADTPDLEGGKVSLSVEYNNLSCSEILK